MPIIGTSDQLKGIDGNPPSFQWHATTRSAGTYGSRTAPPTTVVRHASEAGFFSVNFNFVDESESRTIIFCSSHNIPETGEHAIWVIILIVLSKRIHC